MTEFNFNEDVAIDLDNLHEEWQKHAQTRHKYANEISYLERVTKKAHEKVKVTRSRLIREAKELKLASADLREAHYREHKDHKEAKEEQIEAEYQLSMAWNAVKAFDDKKTALEDEVKLWTRNYFATPREERMAEGGKKFILEQDIARDKVAETQREVINKRRRK